MNVLAGEGKTRNRIIQIEIERALLTRILQTGCRTDFESLAGVV